MGNRVVPTDGRLLQRGMSATVAEILLIALLLGLNGLLAMSEMAIVAARKARLRRRAEDGDAGAAAALALAEEPTRFLSTVQIGITLVGILAGAFGGATLAAQLGAGLKAVPLLAPYAEALGLAIVVVAITFLSLLFGELVPKRLALNAPEAVASLVARPMRAASTLAGPLVSFLTLSTEAVLRLLGARPSEEATVTEEEIRVLIAQGAEAGVFEEAEREIVEGAFELSETEVRELMTPRPMIAWLDVEDALQASYAEIARHPHSYYPICRVGLDEVLGMLSTSDLVAHLAAGTEPDLVALARPALFVPESLPAFRALEQLKQVGPHVALVVDEHGSVEGLLTPTDVLEALVGDLARMERGTPAGPVRREDGSWLLEGLMSLDDVAELFMLPATSEEERPEVQTLGGLAMVRLGRVPSAGDRFSWRGLQFEVLDMDGRRVDKLLASVETPDTPVP